MGDSSSYDVLFLRCVNCKILLTRTNPKMLTLAKIFSRRKLKVFDKNQISISIWSFAKREKQLTPTLFKEDLLHQKTC